jgi:hypothetical protein
MVETDMAKALRSNAHAITTGFVTDAMRLHDLLLRAADEIDRYYNGMMNWKATAEAKDAEYVKQRLDKEQNL